jgi:DNA-directed RNA polymerase subunit RPC12/RpoP
MSTTKKKTVAKPATKKAAPAKTKPAKSAAGKPGKVAKSAVSAAGIVCPHCGKPLGDVRPVTAFCRQDKAIVSELFKGAEGTFNQFACAACGKNVRLDLALVYRDEDNSRLIYYLPPAERTTIAAAEEAIGKMITQLFGADAKPEDVPDCRLTLSLQEFIEKIALLEDGLDDRVVEFIKYHIYLRNEHDIDPHKVTLLYNFTASDPELLEFVIFGRKSGKAENATNVPMTLYHEVKDALAGDKELHEEICNLFRGRYHVNATALF